MIKPYFRISTLLSRLCAAGLALLGFGCASDTPDNPEICMYGTPIGSFEIKGTVTDENNKPVANAEVRVTEPKLPSGVYSMATAKTDAQGNYTAQGTDFPLKNLKVVCLPGEGVLDADSTSVEVKYVKDKHDKNEWSSGKAEATVNFKLKKKQ